MITEASAATESETPLPESESAQKQRVALSEDDDFGDEVLGERQAEACSMEEGCERCQ